MNLNESQSRATATSKTPTTQKKDGVEKWPLAKQASLWHTLYRNASHDIREPLRMVCTYSGLLKAEAGEELSESHREYLDFVCEGANRLRKQTEAMLRLLAVEFQDHPFSAVSMDDALQCALSRLESLIEQKQAQIHLETLSTVWGNPTLMMDLFQAVLENALKFARASEPPHIEVSCSTESGQLVFSVMDNGDGVPEEKLTEIFDPFRRLNPRQLFPGEGLGLTYARRIVEIHKGKIWAEKRPEGFAICFSIPIGEASASEN